uniref:Uncharacterized protein n=1 Tax=Knipowitschia caucasica TaxID=637954 RepID=A0AAV2K9U8_KNICA
MKEMRTDVRKLSEENEDSDRVLEMAPLPRLNVVNVGVGLEAASPCVPGVSQEGGHLKPVGQQRRGRSIPSRAALAVTLQSPFIIAVQFPL